MKQVGNCPFCGDQVTIRKGLQGITFFYCKNSSCGAIVSFGGDKQTRPGTSEAVDPVQNFNRRALAVKRNPSSDNMGVRDADMDQFAKDRKDMLLSLDRQKALAFLKKYGGEIPENEEVFWAGLHKARIALPDFPEEEKEKSREWLREHGFRGDKK